MKNKNSGRIISLVLLGSMLTASLASCGSEPKEEVQTTAAPAETTETTAAETEDIAVPEIPEKNYNGEEFKIFITGNYENNWHKNDFAAEAENGEALNDARFKRNLSVEDRLGVKIVAVEDYTGPLDNVGNGVGFQTISKLVMADDAVYDACMVSSYDSASLAYSGYLYNLREIPYLNLNQRWWDQKINSDLTIGDKLFYTTGDISTADNDATCAILFNKHMVTENDMQSPYELVNSGKWTIDAMASMCKDISADLNGDSKMDKNDRFGAIVWDDTMMAIINAGGEKCCTVNEKGEIELTLMKERTTEMFDSFAKTFFDSSISYAYQRISYDITDPVNMFSNDQALFFIQLLDLVTYFRDMKTDFGILPFPKLDEEQESYYNTIGSWHSTFLSVPTAQKDPERTGIVLEALAAESYNVVTPAYYEKTLVGKYVRDDESADMLDIILATRVYDLGWFYGIGNYHEEIMNLWRKGKTDFVSMYEKNTKNAQKKIDMINEAFAAIE